MKKVLPLLISALLMSGCSTGSSSASSPAVASQEEIDTGSGNVLVAYFSVTNNTKKLAGYAKDHLESDIFEIVPLQSYTSADIDYNSDCRANREQNNPKARPAIKNRIADIGQYDTIVLGYPIWWGQAPRIMYTFLESYDFEGKTILPFCTSGSSSIGSSATNLSQSAPKATWLEGRRFAASTDQTTIGSWLDQYIKKEDKAMELSIDGKTVAVSWEQNDSVKALAELAPIEVSMSRYGGFEQVGSIGRSIVSNDANLTTRPGDIVLYNSSNIVIFFGSNTWSYTKLGHIDLSQDELSELLDKESVAVRIA